MKSKGIQCYVAAQHFLLKDIFIEITLQYFVPNLENYCIIQRLQGKAVAISFAMSGFSQDRSNVQADSLVTAFLDYEHTIQP